MTAWLAVETPDAEEASAALLDSKASALEALALEELEAASLADEDELFAGAAHATNIVAQQHSVISPVSIRFMAVPFLKFVSP
jgi:hypothetical protein